MTDMVQLIVQWRFFLLVLLVFGFAPRAVLRVVLLAYPSGSPRREELMAELAVINRIERPIWVAEQIEMALMQGLPSRVHSLIMLRKIRRELSALRHQAYAVDEIWSAWRSWGPWDERTVDAFASKWLPLVAHLRSFSNTLETAPHLGRRASKELATVMLIIQRAMDTFEDLASSSGPKPAG